MLPKVLDSKHSLGEQVANELMACIGCHDCMLACPLPEASEVTIAELNDALHRRSIVLDNVTRFVAACTQCRQCVPACPADLSRADMVLWNKLRLEDSVPDRPVWLQVGPQVHPSPWTIDSLARELMALRLFNGVSHADLRRLALKVTLRWLAPGEAVHRRGEYHERLSIVLSGALEQSAVGERGEHVSILFLSPGSFFGELAVMADEPEAFDVRAVEPAIVVEVPKAAVHQLVTQSATFAATMEELYRRRALSTYADRLLAQAGLSPEVVADVRRDLRLVPLRPAEQLFAEGAATGRVFLVKSGFLRASRGAGAERVTTVYFREGDVIGLLPILQAEKAHLHAVTAACRAELVELPGDALRKALLGRPDALRVLLDGALMTERVAHAKQAQAAQAGASSGPSPDPSSGLSAVPGAPVTTLVRPLAWEALVEHGVAQGSEVLVIDQTRCTHCRSCIDACGRRHGHSRLALSGLQLDHLLFPTACRHCDDPVCLLCSVQGIVRRPTGEISIVEDNCVGCGACASRCPYGNIRMHPVDKPKRGLLAGIWALIGFGDDAPRETDDPKVPRVAVKCDLCAGYGDYACVSACPVGAAARVDPLTVISSSRPSASTSSGTADHR